MTKFWPIIFQVHPVFWPEVQTPKNLYRALDVIKSIQILHKARLTLIIKIAPNEKKIILFFGKNMAVMAVLANSNANCELCVDEMKIKLSVNSSYIHVVQRLKNYL